ncbi:glycosyltransferase family 4 protein [Marinilactibacillus psychrotolerans]|uniref:Glycosyltransferase family 4 protein n=1 Tax=Marinilactibacillus psychrotolerans TaxID=191770 RepID=A0ABW8UPC9_9LACT
MENQIFICGNFGYRSNQLDGQTIKTRVLKEEIGNRINTDIVYTDTSFIKKNPFSVLRNVYINFKRSSHIIIMPDSNAFKVLLPFYILLNKKRKDIRYVVIGGWLPGFLEKSKFYRFLCTKINGIYVEANEMKERMQKIGLENTKILPNFREFKYKAKAEKQIGSPMKLVYFSRVLKEKGVELAIQAVNEINRNKVHVKLDIIGPINEEYKLYFQKIIGEQGEDIKYKGFLEPNEIHEVLSKYDAMIFPTYFESEGFPGAVIDAYIAGLPVLASDWKYNKEFVIDQYTGIIFKVKDVEDIILKIKYLLANPEIVLSLRENCINQAFKYHVNSVFPELIRDMGLESNSKYQSK